MTINLVQATLVITPIESKNGFTMINMGEGDLINQTQTVIHIVNINKLVDTLEEIKKFEIVNQDQELKRECYTLLTKILSLMPSRTRSKRGLINIIGTTHKWLFGTMDNDDREEIDEHLKIIETNDRNAIQELNKQIKINTQLDQNMKNLKDLVLRNRQEIELYQNESQKLQKTILNRLQRTEVLTRLLMFEKLIDNLLDTIAAAKMGITHPSLLTKDELVMTDMNLGKLKNIKSGVMKYTDEAIIIALKIPEEVITLPIKIILPITNEKKEEIDLEPFFVISYNGKEYIYDSEKNNVMT